MKQLAFRRKGRRILSPVATVLLLCWLGTLRLLATADGIFADFKTSLGDFTCKLDPVTAPKAVANFVGLATGERAWVDASGTVRTRPFYDGLTFHRVIKGFMNQSGSPNGEGTDGPGYAFQDEFNAAVRHDAAGTLSMANSGKNSNGAQFFVTAAATPWLNDVHTIFGRVVSGLETVNAINIVGTGENDRPTNSVIVQSVTIRRVGTAATAFDIHAQGLPQVFNVPLQIAPGSTNVDVTFSNQLHADNRLFASTNLTDWHETKLGIALTEPPSGTATVPATNAAAFYQLAQVRYPGSTFSPPDVRSRKLTLTFNGGQGSIIIQFDAQNAGTYTYVDGNSEASPGTITEYEWFQEPYAARLWPVLYSDLVPMTLRLGFNSATGGTFSGTAYFSPFPSQIAGTFTLE